MIIILLWILTVILYLPIFMRLYSERWAEIDYTHAYFILPVSLGLIWLKKKELYALPIDTTTSRNLWADLGGLFLLILGCFLFTFGWRWDYLCIETIALIPILLGLTRYLYSPQHLRLLLFPSLYLLLLAPLPLGVLDSITLPMRHWVSLWAEHILRALHYPVSRQGLLLRMNEHELFMGAPCSGFRSLITMVSLGLLYIYFNRGGWFKNIVLFASILPLALFGNLMRILTLCLITFYFGKEAGEGFFHNFSGMVIFLIMLGGLMALELLLDTVSPAKKEKPFPSRTSKTVEQKSESQTATEKNTYSSQRQKIRACLAALILLVTLSICFGLPKPKYESAKILDTLKIPTEMPQWRSIDMSSRLNLQQDDRYSFISGAFARVYGNPGGEKLLFLILDAGNFHHPKICFTRSGFQMKDLNDTEFHLPHRTLKAKTLFAKRGTESFAVIYWIVIDKTQVDWNQQKLKQLWFSLWNKKKIGLMLRLDIPTDEEHIENSLHTAQQFIQDIASGMSKENLEFLFAHE